jgi:hypothetical protein
MALSVYFSQNAFLPCNTCTLKIARYMFFLGCFSKGVKNILLPGPDSSRRTGTIVFALPLISLVEASVNFASLFNYRYVRPRTLVYFRVIPSVYDNCLF